ncbi:MAG: hypothetical protein IJ097_01140 [Bacilli bacterium]|nr:hypothetical protein [Bacilli bacterium]
MIIGNDNNFNNTDANFRKKFNTIKEASKNNINITNQKLETPKYTNINNKEDMIDRSFNMLQQRLNQGLISLDEFNKQCNKLNKLRNK